MLTEKRNAFGLSGNQLKILAIISMTCDHVGLHLLPQFPILRIIGRLAFPIFAYMIAEGCRHTKNRTRYFLTVFLTAMVCQIVYLFVMQSLYQSILVTFSLSILLIYVGDYLQQHLKSPWAWLLFVVSMVSVALFCDYLPHRLSGTDFSVDYGFLGVLVPVWVFMGKSKITSLLLLAVGLVNLTVTYGGTLMWYSLLALIPLALYNGQRGKWKMKYFFYIYYPLHLAAIYGIGLLVR